MVSYREIFAGRGDAYDEAMDRWPQVRAEEFAFAVDVAGIAPGDRVLDVPAGGGYLRDHLPEGTVHVAVEPSSVFVASCRRRGIEVVEGSLRAEAVPDASVDVVVSVAGVHHEDDHTGLLASWARVVWPGGTVAMLDVVAGSAQAMFLDGFVGDHNAEGHEGSYLSDDAGALAVEAGLVDVRTIDGSYHWWAPDEAALGEFCAQLFGLSGVTAAQTFEAIEAGPGIDRDDAGRVGMRWALRAVIGRSPGEPGRTG